MFTKALLATALLTAATHAHQNLHQFWINDETPGYQTGIRMPPSNSPIEDVTSPDIACNVGGSTVPSTVATVPANEGDTITVQWDQSGHPGPITHFLFGPVEDASLATGIGAGWFKIDELDYEDGQWANEIMGTQNMTRTFRLPVGLQSGEYLLRSEMLALHGAQTVGGAQFYVGCAQLKVTGTGTGACTPSISLPGAYAAEDENIYIPDVYNGFDPTTYSAPGGPVAVCGGGAGAPVTTPTAAPVAANSTSAAVVQPTSASGSTPAAASSSATTVVVVDSSSAAPISSPLPTPITAISSAAPILPPTTTPVLANSSTIAVAPTTFATLLRPSSGIAAPTGAVPSGTAGTAKLYYQCGGQGWTGATVCEGAARCVVQNAWYSQCLN
ncbi:hypothetical protein BDW02DRAFT_492644 [Decorospora gaudefroyi]|uniref:AA9 family lytic polysaccharide monooxygenase n=1 Tax=Decorospora gaudefroyi TaxID=184978 RepID=A0A6A5KF86_9PLEO|nr:hypothetical protein BDW02DRAFT_492644 [Decorospora gaudefroyi]